MQVQALRAVPDTVNLCPVSMVCLGLDSVMVSTLQTAAPIILPVLRSSSELLGVRLQK